MNLARAIRLGVRILVGIPLRVVFVTGVGLLIPVFSDSAAKKWLPGSSCNGAPCSLTEMRIGLAIGGCVCIAVALYIWIAVRRGTSSKAFGEDLPAPAVVPAAAPMASVPAEAGRLNKLEELHSKGLIDEQELAEQRRRILDEL